MMFTKDKPGPAHDLAEMNGDPWLSGNLHDRSRTRTQDGQLVRSLPEASYETCS
jgi:hypothetical protein